MLRVSEPRSCLPGFVLAGIPLYYLTHRAEGEASGIQGTPPCGRASCGAAGRFAEFTDIPPLAGFFANIAARIRGRPAPGAGWQAVATEGDDTVEMEETRTPAR
ncbi:hypothetical protein FKP32DRAFT_1586218 [Trametes sanguinea]|nr:hypothetical protein FKP32DRAFT_1586218 [Trametes sanguinea]